MDRDRHRRLRELFERALELPQEDRGAFLGQQCEDEPELRREVQRLLENDQKPDGPGGTADIPERIGPYQLLEVLGEGGMGIVYLAQQQEPILRRVALKVIKAGMDTREVIARFETERQALALMNHPNVAKVLEAGTTEHGRPYFVMEYVPGVTIVEHCDRNRLPTVERLKLFCQVCEGVQHAHQKGVIHRDLKPTNILVEVRETRAVTKIIDFGVAKATAHRLTQQDAYTRLGELIGTPEYMSPEQAEMTAQDVDTRTDVYSLGVVLYELLVGALPFDPRQMRQSGFDQIRRMIREEEPSKPSTRLSTLGESALTSAANRSTDPTSLARRLRGDLDWITMRALEKDRTRRYDSPMELAREIRRHLRHEPVVAGPPSVTYRARKFVRRHRIAVSFAAMILLALTAFATRERVQRERISREHERANRVSAFLTELFTVSDPKKARGKTISVEELLRRGAERIHTELADEPEIQADLMHTMAGVYFNLGLYADAEPLARQAMEIRRGRLGRGNRDTLRSMSRLGHLLREQGRLDEAERLLQQTLAGRRRTLGEDHAATLASMKDLGRLLWERGRFKEGEAVVLRALEVQERTLGPEHGGTLASKNALAGLYRKLGRYEDAMELMREVVEVRRRTLGSDHPSTLTNINNLAILLTDLKRYDDAESLYRETLETRTRVLGADHPETVTSIHTLSLLYRTQRRLDEAEPLAQQVIEARTRLLGADHPETLRAKNTVALIRRQQGRYDEAGQLFLDILEGQRRRMGPNHPDTYGTMSSLADVRVDQGRPEEAERLFTEALEGRREQLGPEHRFTLASMNTLAAFHRDQGRYEESMRLFLELLEIRRRVEGERSKRTAVVLYDLACVEALRGDSERALDWLRQSVDAGYSNADWMARDSDLESLHGNPRFEAIVAEAGSAK